MTLEQAVSALEKLFEGQPPRVLRESRRMPREVAETCLDWIENRKTPDGRPVLESVRKHIRKDKMGHSNPLMAMQWWADLLEEAKEALAEQQAQSRAIP